ncbi:MAG: rhomboid family intramembrane serine protease [Halanaerobiaceae bacterium]
MKWLDKLEKKFGHLAINNLMGYIVGLMGSVFLLMYFDRSGTFLYRLVLIPSAVLKGEVWRLITYIFIPPSLSPIFIFFVLYFYYMVGTGLERAWGSFKFNIYYLLGVVLTTLAAFITNGSATSLYLNLTLFLAFARIYPNYEILLFFILPVKMKYLAWFNWGLLAFTIITAPIPRKITAVIAIGNYLIFFGKDLITAIKRRRKVQQNRSKFIEKRGRSDRDQPIHRCAVCGITEKDDPQMQFRYCSKCEGSYEYCMDHLQDHEHVRE